MISRTRLLAKGSLHTKAKLSCHLTRGNEARATLIKARGRSKDGALNRAALDLEWGGGVTGKARRQIRYRALIEGCDDTVGEQSLLAAFRSRRLVWEGG
jgi:hypothetical protein